MAAGSAFDSVPGSFVKTDKAVLELRTREFALPPRARQLLILINGQRDERSLSQFMQPTELLAYLRLLQAEGFIRRQEPPDIGLHKRKQQISEQLVQSAGILAEPMAQRIQQAGSHADLDELLPAACAVVEVSVGTIAAHQFRQAILRSRPQ